MWRRVAFVGFAALVLSVSTGVGVAAAHFTGRDSVDGNEIRYEDYSKWDDSHVNAEREWEGLTGGVNIAPDSATTSADLELRDYNNSSDGLCGYWQSRTGADLLRLNDAYYNGASTTNRRACTIHEWGHAHGLGHSYDDQVMDDCPVSACGSAYTSPQAHDRQDYYQLW